MLFQKLGKNDAYSCGWLCRFRVNFETTSGKRQNSRAYSLRILFSFGFSILEMEPVLKRAENETNQLPQDFIRELISRVKKAHLSWPKKEMIPLSPEEWRKFNESEVCWLCRGKFGEKPKVRDHCHYTGNSGGSAPILQPQVSAAKIHPCVFTQSAEL